ncbi:hypothetical protein F5Y05DRAFT_415426 [Hypoxylon sp. FL0543]|nr:hypothetical protein F5Y05DRAFT_415426 [Hypoxylon sp. FL0543]
MPPKRVTGRSNKGFLSSTYEALTSPENASVVRSVTIFGGTAIQRLTLITPMNQSSAAVSAILRPACPDIAWWTNRPSSYIWYWINQYDDHLSNEMGRERWTSLELVCHGPLYELELDKTHSSLHLVPGLTPRRWRFWQRRLRGKVIEVVKRESLGEGRGECNIARHITEEPAMLLSPRKGQKAINEVSEGGHEVTMGKGKAPIVADIIEEADIG